MVFGPFEEGHVFHIERSATYAAIQEGIKIGEFLLIRHRGSSPSLVFVVEAKSSSPRPENYKNFATFIDEIRDKLANALALAFASCLQRHATTATELPEPFKKLNLANSQFRLVLVINGHRKEWLPPLNEALVSALRSVSQIWALGPNSVAVINDEVARRQGLVEA